MADKTYKNGLSKAIDIIRKLQRYDLEWEWMSENKDGLYIEIEEAKKALIEEIKYG